MRGLKQLVYVLLGLPVGLFGLAYVVFTIVAGSALSLTVVGLPLLGAAVRGARRLGALHHSLARRLIGMPGAAPAAPRSAAGFTDWVTIGLTDRAGWQAAAYLLLKAPIAVLTAAVTFLFYGYGFAALTYPAWWQLVPVQDGHAGLPLPGDVYLDTWPRVALVAVAGVALLLTAPFALRAVVAVDRLAIIALLGPGKLGPGKLGPGKLGPGKLRERVRELEETRAFAVQDAAAALRRIERDLHDGTQARLVALAMTIGAAKERLDRTGADPESRDLVGCAHREAKQALVEVRDLARGIHPPVLDNGLGAALVSLTERTPQPVELTVSLPRRPAPEMETIAYFCVSELLTNVARHSGAQAATVAVGQDGDTLRLRVRDEGRGGARARAGGGLAGLADRVRTVDGRLDVDSPVAGPTVVTVELPCGS
ncbi:sensor histidine kinase [Winogradskya humida]|uniref:histidine kinase n=1 Tax=Winogradskya humida TaxID=113566 RepID=A0ABQ3ZZB4_9ACTN|nr:sensor histidine kinase [Actinoplanes humidus]GIE23922.1 histidine kinase [Actinoplanes humidus]